MKRVITLGLIVTIALSLVGCGKYIELSKPTEVVSTIEPGDKASRLDNISTELMKVNTKEAHEHSSLEVRALYNQVKTRYNDMSGINFPSDEMKNIFISITEAIREYNDSSKDNDVDTNYNAVEAINGLLNNLEFEMSTTDGYRELNQLYSSSTYMMQTWDMYYDYAKSYSLAIDTDVKTYLDKALALSNEISEISYYDLSLNEIDVLQGRVNEIRSYLDIKYYKMTTGNSGEVIET